MSRAWQAAEARVVKLLADRAAFGLDAAELRELDALLAAMPDFDVESFDLAAATVQLAQLPLEPLPVALAARVRGAAAGHVPPCPKNDE